MRSCLPRRKEKGFCQACAGKIIYIGDGGCVKCGKALTDLTQDLCGDCGKKAHAFVQNRAVYAYDGPMKEAMYRFKYSNCRAYRRIFAKDAWRIYGDWLRKFGGGCGRSGAYVCGKRAAARLQSGRGFCRGDRNSDGLQDGKVTGCADQEYGTP